MEGVEAYKNYCIDEEKEVGEDVLSYNSEAVMAAATTGAASQPSNVTVCLM